MYSIYFTGLINLAFGSNVFTRPLFGQSGHKLLSQALSRDYTWPFINNRLPKSVNSLPMFSRVLQLSIEILPVDYQLSIENLHYFQLS